MISKQQQAFYAKPLATPSSNSLLGTSLCNSTTRPTMPPVNWRSHLGDCLQSLTLGRGVAPWLLQRQGATVLLIAPSRILPLISTEELSRRECSKKRRSQDHHPAFKDHECDLIICKLATEAVGQLCHTEQRTDENKEGGYCEC
jgi:hypothetical protein